MRKFFFIIVFSKMVFGDFCPEPAFEDEFEGDKLSGMWLASKNSSFMTSSSLFTPSNVIAKDGKLVIFVNNIGTTDDEGNLFRSTSGEITSAVEFGYGRFEFRITTAGFDAVTETLHLLWFDGDYYKDHQFLGIEFKKKGFMSLLAVNVNYDDEINTFHSTESDSSMQPVDLNIKPRFFTIDYTKDMVSWHYDGAIIRQETTATKSLPNKKLKVVIRNWLIDELKYNIANSDMPVETVIDYFKFTPVDTGGDSCKKIKISETADENNSGLGNYKELTQIIENLAEDENHLIGFSGKITALSVFKSVKVVWVYLDEEWKAYSPYLKIRDTLTKHNIPIITEIPPYTGFWIQK